MKSPRREVRHRQLLGLRCITCVLTGCESINSASASVRAFMVGCAKPTGEWINKEASIIGEAISMVWRQAFPEKDGNVIIDPTNLTQRTIRGTYRVKIIIVLDNGMRKAEIELKLVNPRVVRSSLRGGWTPHPDEYSFVRSR